MPAIKSIISSLNFVIRQILLNGFSKIRNVRSGTYLFVLLLLSSGSGLLAQVSIQPEAAEGYEKRIRQHIANHPVIDTHEHLMHPDKIINSGMFDFTLLFHHYADDDIKSAGMSKTSFNTLLTDSLSIKQKWELIAPYYQKSFNTAYNRVVEVSARELFGIDQINGNTVESLSEKIKAAYQKDWFHEVLKEKCNIKYVINDSGDRSFGDKSMFRYTKRFGYFRINSATDLKTIGKNQNLDLKSIEDLEQCLINEFEQALEQGFLAVKIGIAYSRILHFEDVTKEEASNVIELLQNHPEKDFAFEKVKALSDYMAHKLIQLARKHDKPVQIHTGLQAGDGNIIENSNPTHLANLFLQYRDVQFILFHGGYPFGGELASLAKNFRNVYIDLCWLYIISPSYSERYLHEWLETVPANKIMGFGGDYHNVENVYGHLLFAKEIIGNVLVEKVKKRYFTEQEAKTIASMLLYDNAAEFFKLNPKNH